MKTFWALGQVFYNAAYAMVGTQATAAIQVAVAVQNLSFILVRGIGSSSSIMLGNRVGRNEVEQAQKKQNASLQFPLLLEWSLVVFKA